MLQRFLPPILLASVALAGVAFTADALVVTDEERVAQIGDALVSDGPDAVLATLPSEDDAALRVQGRRVRGDAADAVLRALRPLEGPDRDRVQQSVDVRGDDATLALRVRADGALHDVTVGLARLGQGWVLEDLTVR
jgi:hypothetical protein